MSTAPTETTPLCCRQSFQTKLSKVTSPSETTLLLPLPPPPPSVFRGLLVSVLLFGTAIAMTVPVRPRLILNAANNNLPLASYFTGVVDSLQAVITLFSSPLLGTISDNIGRKPVLIFSQFGELIALFTIAQFPTSLAMQFPGYLGIALTNTYITTANTIIADVSQGDRIAAARNYGYFGAVFGLSFLIGPTLGAYIEEHAYLASSFHAACILIIFAMAFAYFAIPETISSPPQLSQILPAILETNINPIPKVKQVLVGKGALSWLAAAICLKALAQTALNSVIYLFAAATLNWGPAETGVYLSLTGLTMLISQAFLSPLSMYYLGEKKTIVLGYTLTTVHYILYGISTTTEMMYASVFVGMFAFISEPAMKGLVARQAGIEEQGALQGSLVALCSALRPVAPLVSTGLLSVGGSMQVPGLPFFFIAGLAACASILAVVAFRKQGLK